jgi:hypothetical protein
MKAKPRRRANQKKAKTVLRLPDLEHAKAAGSDLSRGPVRCERAHYGMRMTVRIWNVEIFART